MRLVVLSLVLLSVRAAAQVVAPAVPTATPVAPAAPVRPGLLFIAPSGEAFRAARGEAYPVATWFARADADHDGKLTRGEFRRDALSFFPALDQNGDGVVDAREITRYEVDLVPEVRVGFGGGPGYRQPMQSAYPAGEAAGGRAGGFEPIEAAPRELRKLPELPRGAGRYGLINSPQPVVSVDTDLNRRITPQEMGAAADRRFTLLDPDSRGYLTLATLPKTPVQQRSEMVFKKR